MLGLFIAIVVTGLVAWGIGKKGYAPAILLLAGVALLTVAVFGGIGPGLALKKSTGSVFFDIFKVVEQIMSSNLGGLGLSIMAMGGFAKYMDHLNASHALYAVVGKPLEYIKSPYLLACMGFLVSQVVSMAIPSAAGLAMVLMVTLYPLLIRRGVSRLTALGIIGTSRFFDLGPGSANCLLAAKTAGIEWAEYFFNWQMRIAIPLILTVCVAHYFVQRFWDRVEGEDVEGKELAAKLEAESQAGKVPPKIYALLPLFPLIILLTFNPIVSVYFGPKISVGVPAAMVLCVIVTMIFEYARLRDVFGVLAGLKTFFEGMGKQFVVVCSLIIAGQVFGEGLIAIGAVKALITGSENLGFGIGVMIVAMSLVIGVTAFLMGSGNAPFFSFAALIPNIAKSFGVDPAVILLPLQTMTGFGRTVSPVTGALVAIAGMAGVSPFQVVKRTAIPILVAAIVNFILTFTVVL